MIRHKEIPCFVLDNLEKLHKLRVKRGITRNLLSEETEISLSILRRFETGETRPYPKAYNKLAEVFGWEEWK